MSFANKNATIPVRNNFLDASSIYSTGDISDILSGGSNSSFSNDQQHPFSTLQFLDRSDLLVKLSRIIFEDFHSHILTLNNDHYESQGSKEDAFVKVMQRFAEICEIGVKGIERVCTEGAQMDQHSRMMTNQLSLERAAYVLMVKILDSNKLLKNNEDLASTSHLTKLFRESEEFRRISTLLLWNEENSVLYPTAFSKIEDEDAHKLSELDNIYACTKIRGPIHIDSCFVDRIAAEDEEAVQTLNRVIFSLLRSGRLSDAKTLLENVDFSVLSTFVIVREFLTTPQLSPLDQFDDNFNLAKSRLFLKQTARSLIPMDDERIHSMDQCIWATLGGHLPTLLAHAQCTEDRLWAYLSCAAEALLDKELLNVHAKLDDEVNLLALDFAKAQEDLPTNAHSIFTELRNSEHSPYYALFEYLALEKWETAALFIHDYVAGKENVPAHELRFFVHLLIAQKLTGRGCDPRVMDALVDKYASVLAQMKLNANIPFYLFHLSEDLSTQRMLDFLMEVTFEPEQKEMLNGALAVGFDVPNLCRDVFQRYKNKYRIDAGQNNAKSAEELLRAWKWLTYCGTETVWDAIIEANYLLRKLFLSNLMTEAIELMRMAPESLATIAIETFQTEFPDREVPDRLNDARREFECYQLYFESISRYSEWQKHVEGSQAPELPSKLSDERWARMDIRRRTEYELGVQKAHDCLQKYYRLVELYKKRAVEILENVLKMSGGWLVTISLTHDESADPEVRERAADFVQIRKEYLANLLQLLVDIHQRSDEPMCVLEVGALIMDPRYNLHRALDKQRLQKLLELISRAGSALLS